ncbi:ABC transporter ATP-binding protein [Alsobacter metallidurans]|uniref:ABC transporter ATP-binding protein n=1 Tax=Alsobacter metallidurans TaxID=340221 RepID=A0A917I3P3_9HYPH|nr:ABC transporter ATP-binding protein [Alsobacter metallidurans]GGH07396.1 ABC transporter ATP-binding protein [Alsobacter metallidurans]
MGGSGLAATRSDRPAIQVESLSAGYGATTILHGVDLAVAPGEFIAILGSSGCGKTTLLRTIAGFQPSTGGEIRLFGQDVAGLPPEKRGVAMVFQSYALWPHMTVLGNMGYGLKLRGVGKAEIRKRVGDLLAMLNLSGLEDRNVKDLSGGQRQRVALGRALAIDPALLLLDEPLSNLDAKVRLQLRYEIKALQKRLGFAAIHVTHDREEAMTMADRVVIMDAGRIAQIGPPEEIYHHPASPFVAAFLGAENRIDLDVRPGPDGALGLQAAGMHAPAPWSGPAADAPPHGAATAFFREEGASLTAPDAQVADSIVLPGVVSTRAYPGGHYRYGVEAGGRHLSVKDAGYHELGAPVGVRLPLANLHIFPAAQA